jgi:hypothetical protein
MSSYPERKKRFEELQKAWSLNKLNDLMLQYDPPSNLLFDFKFSVMLYISKAFDFEFTSDETEFINRLDSKRSYKENITPNGAVVPKKEYQLEFNLVLRSWSKLVNDMIGGKPELLNKIRMTPNVRIKFGVELEENFGRPLNTSIPHSDAWIDGPWGIICFTPLLGDVENNNLFHYKPKNIDEFSDDWLALAPSFNDMQWTLEFYEQSDEITPIKGKVHLVDYALIHETHRKPNCGTRISIDTTIYVGEYDIHEDRKSEYIDEMKVFGEDLFISTNRSIFDDQILDKKTSFSHYTSGTLQVNKLD